LILIANLLVSEFLVDRSIGRQNDPDALVWQGLPVGKCALRFSGLLTP
jgi:hypothetical protein